MLCQRGELGRIFFAEQALEELRHLRLELHDGYLRMTDLALGLLGMDGQFAFQRGLPTTDATVGLLADAGDLRLGPFSYGDDVGVGSCPQTGRVFGGPGVHPFDMSLAFDLQLVQRGTASGLRGRLHGPGQVGQELRRLARRNARGTVGITGGHEHERILPGCTSPFGRLLSSLEGGGGSGRHHGWRQPGLRDACSGLECRGLAFGGLVGSLVGGLVGGLRHRVARRRLHRDRRRIGGPVGRRRRRVIPGLSIGIPRLVVALGRVPLLRVPR